MADLTKLPVPRRNWALEQYLETLQMCNALRLFKDRQRITTEQWNRLVPPYIKQKLVSGEYVKIVFMGVLLTLQGLEVVAYREATG